MSKTRDNWLFNWFNPTTTPSGLRSKSVTTIPLQKFQTNPVNITKTLSQDCSDIAHSVKTGKPALSKHFSLQRLDSVGGLDFDQNRFSYPPSKGETDIMGNILQAAMLNQAMPHSPVATSVPNVHSIMEYGISQVSGCIASAFERVRSGLSSTVPKHSDISVLCQSPRLFQRNKMQNFGDSSASTKSSDKQLCDTSKCLPVNTVNCVKHCYVAPNVKKMGSRLSDPLFSFSSSPQEQVNSHETKLDVNNPPSVKVIDSNAPRGNVKCETVALSPVSDIIESDNSEVHTIQPGQSTSLLEVYVSEEDEDLDVECRSPSCAVDSCSEASCLSSTCSETCSNYSDSSDDEMSYESENNCDDTDSDNEFCQWDRLTSGRTPWTCSLYKKQTSFRKESQRNSNSTVNNAEPRSQNKKTSFQIVSADPDEEDSFSVEFDVGDDSPHTASVSRPTCMNSSISFILGYLDKDGYDSDVEDCESWCSESEASVLNSHCFDEAELPSNPTKHENSNAEKHTKSSCKLWDYFVNKQNPLTSLSLPTFESCSISQAAKKTSLKSRTDLEDTSYKAPSKVSSDAK